jgi:hypothetical protein
VELKADWADRDMDKIGAFIEDWESRQD